MKRPIRSWHCLQEQTRYWSSACVVEEEEDDDDDEIAG